MTEHTACADSKCQQIVVTSATRRDLVFIILINSSVRCASLEVTRDDKAEHGSRLTCGLPDLDPPNYLQVQVLWVQVTHTVGQLRVQV